MLPVFLGSSSEALALAKILTDALRARRLRVRPWWEKGEGVVFRPGKYTLEALNDVMDEVSGCVFLCTPDDKTWFRDHRLQEPRDNVVFEYGLSLARFGRYRAIIVKRPGVKLPSDLLGITYVDWDGVNPDAACASIIDALARPVPRVAPDHHSLQVRYDRRVLDAARSSATLPSDWGQKAIYYGTEGAAAWVSLVQAPGKYLSSLQIKAKRDLTRQILRHIGPISVLCSLGPGDGAVDEDIVNEIKAHSPDLVYVPVDISIGLIEVAAHKLHQRDVPIPFAVLGDFEMGQAFIERCLGPLRRQQQNGPVLYSMMGNTLGNLDRYECYFLNELAAHSRVGDALLLEVTTTDRDWAPGEDSRSAALVHSPEYLRLVALGMARIAGEPIEDVLRQLPHRMTTTSGTSDVPGTSAHVMRDARNNNPIWHHRRYRFASLVKWLSDQPGFEVLASAEVPLAEGRGLGQLALRRIGGGRRGNTQARSITSRPRARPTPRRPRGM